MKIFADDLDYLLLYLYIKLNNHYYRYYVDSNGTLIKHNVYLMNDPRENDVPIEGEIVLQKGKYTFISINTTGLTQCPESQLAIASLSSFLSDSGLLVYAATPNQTEANVTGVRYATCENRPNNVVILIQSSSGNQSRIYKPTERCHVIEVANCEMIKTIEKFELQTLVDAKARAIAAESN